MAKFKFKLRAYLPYETEIEVEAVDLRTASDTLWTALQNNQVTWVQTMQNPDIHTMDVLDVVELS